MAEPSPWRRRRLEVVIGAAVCVLSWPWPGEEDPVDALTVDAEQLRPPWRLLYLIPLLVLVVVLPVLWRTRPPACRPRWPSGSSDSSATSPCLLLGAAVFLVVLLPLATLGRSLRRRHQGRAVPAYVPLGAVLVLALVVTVAAGTIGLSGLPDDLGLVFLLRTVVGVPTPGVRVTGPGWLLAARISGLVALGCAAA